MRAFGFGGDGGVLLLEMGLHVVSRFKREKARWTPNRFREDVGVETGVVNLDMADGVTHGADIVVSHVLTSIPRTAESEHLMRIRRLLPLGPTVIVFVNRHDQRSVLEPDFPLLFRASAAFKAALIVAVVVNADFRRDSTAVRSDALRLGAIMSRFRFPSTLAPYHLRLSS